MIPYRRRNLCRCKVEIQERTGENGQHRQDGKGVIGGGFLECLKDGII